MELPELDRRDPTKIMVEQPLAKIFFNRDREEQFLLLSTLPAEEAIRLYHAFNDSLYFPSKELRSETGVKIAELILEEQDLDKRIKLYKQILHKGDAPGSRIRDIQLRKILCQDFAPTVLEKLGKEDEKRNRD